MKKETKILTSEDTKVIPVFLDIFRRRLRDIGPFYEGTPLIQEAREIYTPQYIASCLNGERDDSRFIGHFQDGILDGLLIEGSRTEEFQGEKFPLTILKWVMTRQEGQGIGGALIDNCLQRARVEKKAGVQLMFARDNPVSGIYRSRGFEEPFDHPDYNGIIKIMNYRVK